MSKIDTSTEAVTKLMDGVTPGTWGFFQGEDDAGNAYFGVTARTGDICSMSNAYEWRGKQTIANARFIAAARDLVPALLAERDALRAKLDAAVEALLERRETHAGIADHCLERKPMTMTAGIFADSQRARLAIDAALAKIKGADHD